jgi:macrolide transport system ATP-binding/permease protein
MKPLFGALGTALASARLIQSFLFGVTAHDAWTLACASALLMVSGLSAAYLPARSAASLDPMKALRTELIAGHCFIAAS